MVRPRHEIFVVPLHRLPNEGQYAGEEVSTAGQIDERNGVEKATKLVRPDDDELGRKEGSHEERERTDHVARGRRWS